MDLDAEVRSGRGRCSEHDLARGPDGRCVLCRRDDAAPARRTSVHRVFILVGVLTTLFGGVAFARGVAASRAAHRTPPPPVVSEARDHQAKPPPVQQTPVAEAPKAPPPTEAPAPTTNHRLDDAIAAIPPERPIATTPKVATNVEVAPPAEAPCVCRPRTRHVIPGSSESVWGPGHDKDGHLAVKSRLHSAWGKPLTFNDDGPKCSCPRGTVRVRPHPAGGNPVDHISPE